MSMDQLGNPAEMLGEEIGALGKCTGSGQRMAGCLYGVGMPPPGQMAASWLAETPRESGYRSSAPPLTPPLASSASRPAAAAGGRSPRTRFRGRRRQRRARRLPGTGELLTCRGAEVGASANVTGHWDGASKNVG